MKRRIGVVLLAVWLALYALPVAVFAKDATFSLSVSNKTPAAGDQVVVTVTGNDVSDLYGFEINLKYNEKQLTYKKSASLLQGFSVPMEPDDGELVFAHTKIGNTAGVSGKVELAAITFEATGEGKGAAVIELTRVKLVKSNLASSELKPKSKVEVKPKAATEKITFTDVEGHWAKETIERAVEIGFVNGYGDGTFRPDVDITRAEFVVMAAKAFALKAEGGVTLNFIDVNNIPSWAKPSVSEAEQAGIVKGYDDGSFRPSQLISRSELAVMIMRLHGGELKNATPAFTDTNRISFWAKSSVAAAVKLGVINGKDGNRFAPEDSATRAEATAMLLRLLDAMEE